MLVNSDDKLLCAYLGSILLNNFYSNERRKNILIKNLESILKEDIKFKINEILDPEINEKTLFLDLYRKVKID